MNVPYARRDHECHHVMRSEPVGGIARVPNKAVNDGRCPPYLTEDTLSRGHTHIVMSALECIQRLAALVLRPRLHLIRFHGCSRPTPGCVPRFVPNVRVNVNTPSADHAEVPPPAAPAPMSWARLLTKPPGAVLNGERPKGESQGRLS